MESRTLEVSIRNVEFGQNVSGKPFELMRCELKDTAMKCRVCGSAKINEVGKSEYYLGFAWTIYVCRSCHCRYTKYDEFTYDRLHATQASRYGVYREIATQCKALFDRGDVAALRHELSQTSKYKFIIQSIENRPKNIRVLEVGCSRGYLTSYFILSGYDVTGVDLSHEAVTSANENFGDHFRTADSPEIAERAPYDVIYHVGTIGCVSDPMEMTRKLLSMLKPNGQLLFNAPNVDSCYLKGQLWIDAAPPPDVVTLFRPGFWRRHYSDLADVNECVETHHSDRSAAYTVRKYLGRKWRPQIPISLDISGSTVPQPLHERVSFGDKLWQAVERGVRNVGTATRLSRIMPAEPTPFGLFVTMTKK